MKLDAQTQGKPTLRNIATTPDEFYVWKVWHADSSSQR